VVSYLAQFTKSQLPSSGAAAEVIA